MNKTLKNIFISTFAVTVLFGGFWASIDALETFVFDSQSIFVEAGSDDGNGGGCNGSCGSSGGSLDLDIPVWYVDNGGGGGGGGSYTPPENNFVSCTISASDNLVSAGDEVTFNWTSTNAISGSLSFGGSSLGAANPLSSGSITIPINETGTFVAQFKNGKKKATCSAVVVVETQEEIPECTLTGTPTTINQGEIAALEWQSWYSTSLSIDNGVGSVTPLAGGFVNVSPSQTTTYKMTATGPGGVAYCSQKITVIPPTEYAPYCGDGIVNQSWEACDGGASCTLQCQNQCVEMSFARVVVEDVQNDAGGDLTSDVFLGGALNKIPQGVWFLVHNGTSFVTDSDILSYDDVPGIAVQRMVGKIRSRIVGSNGTVKEHATGYIETFQANVTGQENDPTPSTFYGMENPFDGIKAINPHKDELWTVGDTKSYFFSTVTQYDDGWFTLIETDAPMCGAGEAPTCTLTADPTSISQGGSSTLTWTTTNADSATIDNGVGAVTPVLFGDTDVSPNSTTQYTMTVTGSGGVAYCSATIGVIPVEPNTPWCSISVSPTSINSGEKIKLSWESLYVNEGNINGGIGDVSPVAGGFIDDIYPSDDFEYVGTFTGPYGTTTCSALIDVKTGGGGCTGNCGGGLEQPNVALFKKPGEQPLAFVYLSQIPYTGFEAGPMLTILFWFAVVLWSLGLTYVFLGRQGMQLIAEKVFSYSPISGDKEENQEVETSTREDEYVNGFASTATATHAPLPMEEIVSKNIAPTHVDVPETNTAVDGIPDIASVIESRAHAAGVLLSPEALSMATYLGSNRAETLQIFGEILNDAVRSIPREDGWILLSSDRFSDLKKNNSEVSQEEVVHEPKTVASVISETMSESIHTRIASAILSGDRDTAFSLVRSAEKEGINASNLVSGVVKSFDSVLRSRMNGDSGDMILSENAKHLTDESLKELVDIFAHALDTDYASPFTGVKLALAQAFDVK